VPAVVLGRERRDGHGEERLALAVPTALEREAAHPRRDDWAEVPGIDAEAGLLQHFPDCAVLDRLALVQPAAGSQPPAAVGRPPGTTPGREPPAAARQEADGRGLPLDHHARTVPAGGRVR